MVGGGFEFANYLGYHTKDFPNTYAAIGVVYWLVNYIFQCSETPSKWSPIKLPTGENESEIKTEQLYTDGYPGEATTYNAVLSPVKTIAINYYKLK